MRLRNTVLVRAPQDRVFDFYADPQTIGIIDPEMEYTQLTDGPIGVGARSRMALPGRPPMDTEYTAFERPTAVAWVMSHPGRPEKVHGSTEFEAVADGTLVTLEAEYRYPLLAWLVLLPLWPVFSLRTKRGHERIARAAEAHINGRQQATAS